MCWKEYLLVDSKEQWWGKMILGKKMNLKVKEFLLVEKMVTRLEMLNKIG